MNYKQMIGAYAGIKALCSVKCGAANAIKLAALADRLSFCAELFAAEERKLLRLYAVWENGEPVIENGAPRFPDSAAREAYIKERNELLAQPAGDAEPVVLRADEFRLDEGIRAADLLGVSPFVILSEEVENSAVSGKN